jgi:ribosomal-protein-alanine N-acetyltransferase
MILETERLYLRRFKDDDLDALASIYANPNVMRFIGTGETFTNKQTGKSIQRWNEYEDENGFSNWAVIRKADGMFLGKCGLSWLPDKSDVEISYILDEPYWGMGYATEISKATLLYGMKKLKINRITALVYPQNSPSIRVIEKMGMIYEKEAEFWGIKFLMYSISSVKSIPVTET